jgi:hypothetical protein
MKAHTGAAAVLIDEGDEGWHATHNVAAKPSGAMSKPLDGEKNGS